MPTAPAHAVIHAVIEYQERLRSMALSDDQFVGSVLGMGQDTIEISRLDAKTHALVRLAALLAVGAAQSSYSDGVERALASGASVDEIVGLLIAIAPSVGLGRVVAAAPELGLALGYDVEAALESA